MNNYETEKGKFFATANLCDKLSSIELDIWRLSTQQRYEKMLIEIANEYDKLIDKTNYYVDDFAQDMFVETFYNKIFNLIENINIKKLISYKNLLAYKLSTVFIKSKNIEKNDFIDYMDSLGISYELKGRLRIGDDNYVTRKEHNYYFTGFRLYVNGYVFLLYSRYLRDNELFHYETILVRDFES